VDILDDMGVSKLSAKVFLKVNYSFNGNTKMFCVTVQFLLVQFLESFPLDKHSILAGMLIANWG